MPKGLRRSLRDLYSDADSRKSTRINQFLRPGQTNITKALPHALSLGRPVVFDSRTTYQVRQPITLPSGSQLRGQDGTALELTGTNGQLFNAVDATGIQIQGFEIDFAHFPTFADLIHLLRCSRVHIHDMDIKRARRTGIKAESSTDITIHDSRIFNSRGNAVFLQGSTHCKVERLTIGDNLDFGVFLRDGSHHNLMRALTTKANGLELVGIVTGDDHNIITECQAEGSGDNGFSCSGDHNVVSGNIATGNGFNGIGVWGNHNSVSGNICHGNGFHGLALNGSYNALAANSFTNNGQAGPPGTYAGVTIYPHEDWHEASFNTLAGTVMDDTGSTQSHNFKVRTGAGVAVPTGNVAVGSILGRSASTSIVDTSGGVNQLG